MAERLAAAILVTGAAATSEATVSMQATTEVLPTSHAVLEVARPWGRFRQYTHNDESTVKVITVGPGGTLSLQRHRMRDEFWVILDPGLRVQVGDRVVDALPGAEFFIPCGTTHRLSSIGPRGRVLEIALGRFDEDDIERLEDAYGRG